jgi:hypothetical protein
MDWMYIVNWLPDIYYVKTEKLDNKLVLKICKQRDVGLVRRAISSDYRMRLPELTSLGLGRGSIAMYQVVNYDGNCITLEFYKVDLPVVKPPTLPVIKPINSNTTNNAGAGNVESNINKNPNGD